MTVDEHIFSNVFKSVNIIISKGSRCSTLNIPVFPVCVAAFEVVAAAGEASVVAVNVVAVFSGMKIANICMLIE